MNYQEALEYIHSVVWMGSRPGLSRTLELLRLLGNPEKDMKFIHVAGTNGKGSTCAMLSAILKAAGYKVGLYTSPYIVRFNERMCINGQSISDEELAELVSIVKPLAESMEDKPTEFELITAISFLYYIRNKCDIVVLEVGMGGRLDSTNVITSPVVSTITGVALDHTGVLGNTVSEIAFEKAGIIKEGRPVVYGGRDDIAFGVVSEKAKECSSKLVRTNLDLLKMHKYGVTGIDFDYGDYKDLHLSLFGTYQLENAATVLETVSILNENGFSISIDNIKDGLKDVVWRARFELLAEEPPVIFDGSHNIQGVTGAAETIKRLFGDKVILLMGVLADKDYRDMAEILAPYAEMLFTVTPDSPRALDSAELAKVFVDLGVNAKSFETVEQGVVAAYEVAKRENKPLVMLGSLYMYGEVYNVCKKHHIKR